MQNIFLKFLVPLIICLGIQDLLAQDTIRLKESIAIKKNETYSLNAGTVLVLGPNVRIQIEGGVQVVGTSNLPIQVISENSDQPGEGFIIKSNNYAATVNFNFVNFVGLIQPLRFDPYWSRKEVNLDNMKISKSNFFEPIIFISSPMIDINKNLGKINILNSQFYNNNSGIIVESAGNVKYEINLNNLAFYENDIKGIDKTLGVLHVELAKPFYTKNLKIGNLAFNRNATENAGIGLSVAGNQDSISIEKIYSQANIRPIYDNQNDIRLPYVNTTIADLSSWNEDVNWIKSINHKTDTLIFEAKKALNITQLLDSTGNFVPFTLKQINGKTLAYYNETISFKTIPVKAIIDNNYSVLLPSPTISNDTTRTKFLVKQQPGLWIPSSAYYFPFVKFIRTFEVTAWGGLATYFGDVKTRWGLPGALDWSGGFGLQYNYSKKISFSSNFYNFSVSMGNASAALYIGRSAPVVYSDKNKGLVYDQNTFEFNFITEIKSIDFNVLWNLKPLNTYESTKSNKVTYTPILGLGFTVFKFDPYRNLYYSNSADSNVKVSLRELGTEGQNYNGKGTYGQYSAGLNAMFQFKIGYKRFHLKGDIKYVLTFTDYLDDYGKGILYGGDYNKWVETNNGRLDQPIKMFDRTVTARSYFPEYNLTSKRTTDILTDAYMQFHIGVGYDIGTLKKRK